jgi:hypothetical protein
MVIVMVLVRVIQGGFLRIVGLTLFAHPVHVFRRVIVVLVRFIALVNTGIRTITGVMVVGVVLI